MSRLTAGLEFGLLGPLLVSRDSAVVPIPAGRQRALLAALLLNAGRVVSVNELIDVLWGADPPASARASLHNCVGRLRANLGDDGDPPIRTRPPGYVFSVGRGELRLDVTAFEALLQAAQTAVKAGQWDLASAKTRAALSLWRGDPLADVDSQELARREVPRLAEMRLQALEIRLDADLRLGGHQEVIPELRHLAAGYPLREHLHGLLMLALYRSGRQAEALSVYQDAREVLVGELGTEPGSGLRELHQRMLNADPALSGPEPVSPEAASTASDSTASDGTGPDSTVRLVPRELPGSVRIFVGRDKELATLTQMLRRASGSAPGTMVISAISGMPGVGKTALVVHWAHQVAEHFPDGQLYVNLRGYDPGEPMTVADALTGFLTALGVPSREIPAGEVERAARYRSLVAGRRMLVLLDNARSAGQVRPLLPTDGCVVVVTSRDALAGLVAREGARRLDLDLLQVTDAVGLLQALIGDRAAADPAATLGLADQCARLPLALRVAAERVVANPHTRLADLVTELADERRLDLLDSGSDQDTAVRAVFSWSCRHLEPAAVHTFRLASLHPGPDLDVAAVATLTGVGREQAGRALDLLARAYLIQPTRPRHYGLHDLLRAYARELCDAQDGHDEQAAALTRLFDHYLRVAGAAMDVLFPAERHRRPDPGPPSAVPLFGSPAAARAWLDAERACLAAAAGHAATQGWPRQATRLSATLFRYLDVGGYYSEALAIHGHAHQAARAMGDRAAEGHALTSLAVTQAHKNLYQQARSYLEQSLPLFRAAADLAGEARALVNMGFIEFHQGCNEPAAAHFQLAAAQFREIGDQSGEALALGNLGDAQLRQGRYDQATRNHRRCLALSCQLGDQYCEVLALNGLGEAFLAAGQAAEARMQHDKALGVARQIGARFDQARAHNGLGHAYHALGDPDRARRQWRQALVLYTYLAAPEANQIRALLTAADSRL
ncbi:MAG TPA: BTAD domain-containing putative transcriptional regulator [Streptosporangiaceae bacterium]|nr:BTAD domain-containing putative transcriptional regulator [Streptosporangiaceae bacterium]